MIKQHLERNANSNNNKKQVVRNEEGKTLHSKLFVRSKEFWIQHSRSRHRHLPAWEDLKNLTGASSDRQRGGSSLMEPAP